MEKCSLQIFKIEGNLQYGSNVEGIYKAESIKLPPKDCTAFYNMTYLHIV